MIGFIRRLFSKSNAVPPSPSDPYDGMASDHLPVGRKDGGKLTLAESRYIRERVRAKREAIERDILRGEDG